VIYIFKDGNMIVLSDANHVDSLSGGLLTEQEANLIASTMGSDNEHDVALAKETQGNEPRDPNAPTN